MSKKQKLSEISNEMIDSIDLYRLSVSNYEEMNLEIGGVKSKDRANGDTTNHDDNESEIFPLSL